MAAANDAVVLFFFWAAGLVLELVVILDCVVLDGGFTVDDMDGFPVVGKDLPPRVDLCGVAISDDGETSWFGFVFLLDIVPSALASDLDNVVVIV